MSFWTKALNFLSFGKPSLFTLPVPNAPRVVSTAEVMASRKLDKLESEKLELWAEKMMLKGFNSEALCCIAGGSKFDRFRISNLLDEVVFDLKLPTPDTLDNADEVLIAAQIRDCLKGVMSYEQFLTNFKDYGQFHSLFYALKDLMAKPSTLYLDGVTRNNIEETIRTEMESWPSENLLEPWVPYEWSPFS